MGRPLIVLEENQLKNFVNRGFSVQDISHKLKISDKIVARNLKRYGLITKHQQTHAKGNCLSIEKFKACIDKGMKSEEIATYFNCSRILVLKKAREYGLKIAQSNLMKLIGKTFNNLLVVDAVRRDSKLRVKFQCLKCKEIYELDFGKFKKKINNECPCRCSHKYYWRFIVNNKEIKCRSGYEVLFANYLITNEIPFEFEQVRFEIINSKTGVTERYTPDFYLPNENIHIETKGSFRNGNPTQFSKIAKIQNHFDLQVLFWEDIATICNLPKHYSYLWDMAHKHNMNISDFLAHRLYLESQHQVSV